ncbi:MAG: HlyD family secretion protein, partial [Pseudomonas sp.]
MSNALENTTRTPWRSLLMVGFPVLIAAAGYVYYLKDAPYVSTDNAYARVAKA